MKANAQLIHDRIRAVICEGGPMRTCVIAKRAAVTDTTVRTHLKMMPDVHCVRHTGGFGEACWFEWEWLASAPMPAAA